MFLPHFRYIGLMTSLAVYLQVIDVLLGIKIDALGFLLNGHHGEPHINAAMKLPLLNLQGNTLR